MAIGRIDRKPAYKPMPKPASNIGEALKEAAERANKPPIKIGEKPKMKDDKYDGEVGKAWEKGEMKWEKKEIPEAPGGLGGFLDDIGDAVESVVDAAGDAAESVGERIADAVNPFN